MTITLITGVSKGIGYAAARRLIELCHEVAQKTVSDAEGCLPRRRRHG